jgi:hypothetical protein
VPRHSPLHPPRVIHRMRCCVHCCGSGVCDALRLGSPRCWLAVHLVIMCVVVVWRRGGGRDPAADHPACLWHVPLLNTSAAGHTPRTLALHTLSVKLLLQGQHTGTGAVCFTCRACWHVIMQPQSSTCLNFSQQVVTALGSCCTSCRTHSSWYAAAAHRCWRRSILEPRVWRGVPRPLYMYVTPCA